MNNQQPTNLNISLEDTEALLCDKCGEDVFIEGMKIRKVSGILSGTGQPSYLPIPVFICNSCGHVNEEFLPKEVKGLKQT